MRLRGREDLFFLGKHILGHSWLRAGFHDRLAWAWQAPNGWRDETGKLYDRFRAAVVARGHLKTTLLTQDYAVFCLIRDPEERILIYTMHKDFAAVIMNPIKTVFEGGGTHGQLFLNLYGDLIPAQKDAERWTTTDLTLNRKGAWSDPSLRGRGVGSRVTGTHPTKIIVDDMVGEPLDRIQMRKVLNSFDNLTPLLYSTLLGERRYVGTPWGFQDPSMYIAKNWPEALVARLSWKNPDGSLLFPPIAPYELHGGADIKEIENIKKRNRWFYMCQYEVWPKDEEKRGFREEWFKYFRQKGGGFLALDDDEKEIKRVDFAECNTFIFVDPNTAREPGQKNSIDTNKPVQDDHDFMAWVVICVAPNNDWYIPRAFRMRCNVDEAIDKTYELLHVWSPKFIAWEQRSAQILWKTIFKREWQNGRERFVMREWEGGNESKEERIKRLIPLYASGAVYHRDADEPAIAEGIDALEGELIDYPSAKFDDLSDALSAGVPLVYRPGAAEPAKLKTVKRDDAFEARIMKLDAGSRKMARMWKRERDGRKADEFWFNA